MRTVLVGVVAALATLAVTLPAPADAAAKRTLLVSVGDSYASGFQPTSPTTGANTRNGFAYQVPRYARQRGYRLRVVNFGCAAATTTSVLRQRGCSPKALGPGGKRYPRTSQAAAAVRYLRANRKRVAVVTVSIGGNDVTPCAVAPDAVTCVGTAVKQLDRNLRTLLQRLRRAAGPKVRIVGITYPDVILGSWLRDDAGKQLAALSQVAFKAIINPKLEQRYTAVRGRFVDVTEATGGYDSLETLVSRPDLSPTPVPEPVARVCDLTFFCEFGDIHARTAGYGLIAKRVAATLPRRR